MVGQHWSGALPAFIRVVAHDCGQRLECPKAGDMSHNSMELTCTSGHDAQILDTCEAWADGEYDGLKAEQLEAGIKQPRQGSPAPSWKLGCDISR